MLLWLGEKQAKVRPWMGSVLEPPSEGQYFLGSFLFLKKIFSV